ncbi:hypothetical protein [Spirilliplanes yamanashiensis]|uniref:Uncharacterized protein n=1 Tax=Spirilliplanes yamanashiensis TaxID=42233 RepID=A0A8J4DIX9_9ACTN|nr:hypothetical protein [Spirilliplanes yamanashiensis]MDP9815149.1 hypothetical protein [Spirilliplanes yamanashiensis]GIJ02804.1 hypothetical protein Sya03_21560 [Spirilliplanes yamanashiensis]
MTNDSPLARRDVLEAILVLRAAGITAEQYRDADMTEHWTVGGVSGEFPDKDAAITAAGTRAAESGEDAEVRRSYGFARDRAELEYIVKPDRTTWLP